MSTQIFIPQLDKSTTIDNIIDIIQFEYSIGKIKSVHISSTPNDNKHINVYIKLHLNIKNSISQHLLKYNNYSIPVLKYSDYEDRTYKMWQLIKI